MEQKRHRVYLKQIKIKVFSLFFLFTCSLSAEQLFNAIQVGAFSSQVNIQKREALLKDFKLHTKKLEGVTKIYALNSEDESIESLLSRVRKIIPDAFRVKIKAENTTNLVTRSAIHVGDFSDEDKLKESEKRYKDYRLYKQKEQEYTRLYVLSSDIKNTLEQIKFFKHDAKITKIKVPKEQASPKKKESKKQKIEKQNLQKEKPAQDKTVEYYSKEPKIEEEPVRKIRIGSQEEIQLRYKAAVNLYNTGKFEKAYTLFLSLRESDMPQTRIEFYIGRCAYKLKNYEEALHSFEAIRKKEPENLRVKLELAQIYKKLKMFDKSEENFQYVLKKNIPKQVRKNVMLNIAQVQKLGQKNFFSASALAGVSYDSNVLNETQQANYQVYIPTIDTYVHVNSGKEKSSYMFDTGALVNHLYKGNSNFFMQNTFNAYASYYPSYEDKNVDVVSLDLQPTYLLNEKTKLAMSFYADNVWYGNENFLNNFSFTPKIATKLYDNIILNNSLKFSYQKFTREADRDKDLRKYTFNTDLSMHTYWYGLFNTSFSVGQTERIRGVRTDIEKDFYSFGVRNQSKIFPYLDLTSRFNTEFDKYKFVDANFLNKRSDTRYTLGLGLNYHTISDAILNLGFQYTNQSSNQAPFDYDKYIIRGSVMYNY